MDLTVCICTHDRPRYLRDCLDGLRCQTVAETRFRILVVDSGTPEPARSELRDLVRQYPNARLLRVDELGVSAARNAGAHAATTEYIAYIDDDAIPAETWVEAILAAISERGRDRPAVLGGRILPKWEALLPGWWPPELRGLLSIIEHEGTGEYRTNEVPPALEPYGCNMIVHVKSLLDAGGFGSGIGRIAGVLLSDEDVQLAWRLQDDGCSVRYDSNIVVFHQIQAKRLKPDWLLNRLYWQGASTVLTRRLLHDGRAVWRELPRRLLVAALFAPATLFSKSSTECLGMRWRQAYSAGFVRAALGWRAAAAARRLAHKPPPPPVPTFARVPPPVPPPTLNRMPSRVPIRSIDAEPTQSRVPPLVNGTATVATRTAAPKPPGVTAAAPADPPRMTLPDPAQALRVTVVEPQRVTIHEPIAAAPQLARPEPALEPSASGVA